MMNSRCWKSSPRSPILDRPPAIDAGCEYDLVSEIFESDAMKSTDFIDNDSLRDDIPAFGPGDELKVHVRVVEGGKERIQVFQGNVLKRQGTGLQETYTVRKLSYGVGVERTFPLHAPTVQKIEVVRRGDVRRAKLYYLRDRVGKAAKVKEKRTF